ncbi:endoglucanase [Devosia sp. UYZn731]|uniref:glycoside hydrolase family 5 protein n=1 Tax=Devosia sp. UYZn731 TaxID=3156345 RepID=UPI003396B602
MKNRSFAIALISLLALGSAQAAPLVLHRGIGVHDWLNWAPLDASGNYRQPPYNTMSEWLSGYRPLDAWPAQDQFERMKGLGFDFVRLSVDPGPLLANDGAQRQAALDVLDKAVRHVVAAGLKVVFNLHFSSQVDAYSQEAIEQGADSEPVARYNAMVVDVAKMLAAVGIEKVAIEPYNEPHYYPCDDTGTDDWQRIQTAQVQMIRAVSPDITIVATGACGGDIADLLNLDATAFDDPNILYSFHMYDPHSFTHQRIDDGGWASGLPWPASSRSRKDVEADLTARMDAAGVGFVEQQANWLKISGDIDDYYARNWDKAEMAKLFAQGVDWAKSQGIAADRLFMGEFGVIDMNAKGDSGALPEDRNRYITDARSLAESYGMAWAYWEYANPYGMTFIVPTGPAVPDETLLAPLGLPPTAQ